MVVALDGFISRAKSQSLFPFFPFSSLIPLFIAAILVLSIPAEASSPLISAGSNNIILGNETTTQLGSGVKVVGDVNGDGYADGYFCQQKVVNGTIKYHQVRFFGTSKGLDQNNFQEHTDIGCLSIVSAGDINGDGYIDTIMDNAIFYGGDAGMGSTPDISLSNFTDANFSPVSVKGLGDLNDDGFSDVVAINALQDVDDGAGNVIAGAGVVRIYYGGNQGLDLASFQQFAGSQAGENFGSSVENAGDVDNDGLVDLVVGSAFYDVLDLGGPGKGDDVLRVDAGAIYIFRGSISGAFTFLQQIGGDQDGANFGSNLFALGDVDKDGFSDIAARAVYYDTISAVDGSTIVDAGALYIYFGGTSGFTDTPERIDGQKARFANITFGSKVESLGDINGDGHSDFVVIEEWYDTVNSANETVNSAGVVFLYMGGSLRSAIQSPVVLKMDQSGSHFGSAVEPVGDINRDGYLDLLIGSYRHDKDNTNGNEGAIYVYLGTNSGLTATPFLLEGSQPSENLGLYMSSGDINGDGFPDVLLGAPYFDILNDLGEVVPNVGRLAMLQGLDSGVELFDRFSYDKSVALGESVSGAGDVNGDGYADLIVGAPDYDLLDSSGNIVKQDVGAAFLYFGSATGVDKVNYQIIEGDQEWAYFGDAVRGVGDINGDGFTDVVIGTGRDNGPGLPLNSYDVVDSQGNTLSNAGAVFIYYGNSSGLDLNNPQPIYGDQAEAMFGQFYIAAAGDINKDGFADFMVGATKYDALDATGNTMIDAGAVFLFYGSASGTQIDAPKIFYGSKSGMQMGSAMSAAGDVNGDGFPDLMIAEPSADNPLNSGGAEGRTTVYLGSASGFGNEKQEMYGKSAYGYFGAVVASAGDINGDGYSDVLVGAPGYTNFSDLGVSTGEFSGAAFIYFGSANGVDINNPQKIINDQYGSGFGVVSSAGDINNDGFSDIVIGAPQYGSTVGNNNGSGAFFFFYGSENGILEDSKQGFFGYNNYSRFGQTVDHVGDINGDGFGEIVTGAPYFNYSNVEYGNVSIYSFPPRRVQLPQQVNDSAEIIPRAGVSFNTVNVRQVVIRDRFSGYNKAKLQVEVCPRQVAFGDAQCEIGTSNDWVDIPITGGFFNLSFPVHGGPKHWRSRILYASSSIDKPGVSEPLTPIVKSPWRTPDSDPIGIDLVVAFDVDGDGIGDNIPPTISGAPAASVIAGETYVFNPIFDDVNYSETLTFSVQNLPSWASFDTATGALSGIPADSDYGVYGNIVITVTDSGGLSASLPAFSIDVLDVTAPTVLSSIEMLSNGSQVVTLSCSDNGSACSGSIYYTTDGSTPTTASSQYTGPVTIGAAETLLFFTQDNEGNVSAVQAADFVTIDNPVDGSVVQILNTIRGSVAASQLAIQSVGILVSDNNSALVLLADASFQGSDWSVPTAINWLEEMRYTITVIATDVNGNISTTTATFTYYNGQPAATGLNLGLTNYSIENNGVLDATVTLSRLNVSNANLSDEDVLLHIVDPDGNAMPDLTLTTNYAGQATLTDLGSGGANNVVFDQPGQYTLTAEYLGNGILAPQTSDPKILLVGTSAGYAVIVEGKLPNSAGLDSHNKTTNRIYDSLIERGLVDQDIYYFNYNTAQEGVDAVPSKAAIHNTLANLASEIANRPAPVYVIMVDHGGQATDVSEAAFYLDNEVITPSELNSWLSTLEANLDAIDTNLAIDNPRVVIMGACYSGGFVPGVSKAGRIVMTSAAADEQSYKGPIEDDNVRVGEYFIEVLFQDLRNGTNLLDAFKQATAKTEDYTRSGVVDSNSTDSRYLDDAVQHPLLDDNGDQAGTNVLYSNSGDGQLAKNLVLGFDKNALTNDSFIPADIVRVSATQYLADGENTVTLELYANDPFQVNQAYVEIRAPQVRLTQVGNGSTEQLTSDFVRRAFTPPVNPGDPYTLTFNGFNQAGKYEIYYYVNDRFTGALSSSKKSLVYKDRIADPTPNQAPQLFNLISPTDLSEVPTITAFDWEDAIDLDGDSVTYNLIIADDAGFTSFTQASDLSGGNCALSNAPYTQTELVSSSTIVDANAQLCDGRSYYWKVEAVDAYGKLTTSSQVNRFTTNDTNAQIGIIVAMVTSGITNQQLTLANVMNSFGEVASETIITEYNGNYVLLTQNVGTPMTVTSSKTGYTDQSIDNVQVADRETIELTFSLAADPSLDSDNDGIAEVVDNCPNTANVNQLDSDGDGQGDACDVDDDNDGMDDAFELQYGLDPLDPSDASIDSDADGTTNLQEYQQGTDPFVADAATTTSDSGTGTSVDTATNAGTGGGGSMDLISALFLLLFIYGRRFQVVTAIRTNKDI